MTSIINHMGAKIDELVSALRQIADTSTDGCKGIAAARIDHMKDVARTALRRLEE